MWVWVSAQLWWKGWECKRPERKIYIINDEKIEKKDRGKKHSAECKQRIDKIEIWSFASGRDRNGENIQIRLTTINYAGIQLVSLRAAIALLFAASVDLDFEYIFGNPFIDIEGGVREVFVSFSIRDSQTFHHQLLSAITQVQHRTSPRTLLSPAHPGNGSLANQRAVEFVFRVARSQASHYEKHPQCPTPQLNWM